MTITNPAGFLRDVAVIRADSNHTDNFAEPPQVPEVGRAFKVTLPFDTDALYSGATSYDYEAGKLVLSLSPDKSAPILKKGSIPLRVVLITDSTRSLGSYIGQNAFGATARVQSLHNYGGGIAFVASPRPMKRAHKVDQFEVEPKVGWFFEASLPGPEAKALALKSAVEIEGTYVKVPWDDAGFCDLSGATATIQNPTDYISEKCYVGARIDRIAFVNEATGEVLKEWTAANDPAFGAELWGGIRIGMNMSQVKAIYPSITDYGHLDLNDASVSVWTDSDRTVNQVSMYPHADGQTIYQAFISRYGQPSAGKCVIPSMCEGEWEVRPGIAAYVQIGGQVTYQGTEEKPPTGFYSN